jgi:hypothetical protein
VVSTDHFFASEFDRANGWHLTRIEPMRPLQLDPAPCACTTARRSIEGLKALPRQGRGIYLFPLAEERRAVRQQRQAADEGAAGRGLLRPRGQGGWCC